MVLVLFLCHNVLLIVLVVLRLVVVLTGVLDASMLVASDIGCPRDLGPLVLGAEEFATVKHALATGVHRWLLVHLVRGSQEDLFVERLVHALMGGISLLLAPRNP